MFGKDGKKAMASDIHTLIGKQTEVQGHVRFKGGLHVDGTVKGNVVAEGDSGSLLNVSATGRIEGEVRVPQIRLNGEVRGDVHAAERIELASKAKVTGNVYYKLLEMAIGAEINGQLVHQAQAADNVLPLPQVAGGAAGAPRPKA